MKHTHNRTLARRELAEHVKAFHPDVHAHAAHPAFTHWLHNIHHGVYPVRSAREGWPGMACAPTKTNDNAA